MRKQLIIALFAFGAIICSCEREKDITVPGENGKGTLAFTLKTGIDTRSMAVNPTIQQGAIIPMGKTDDGQSIFLEETITSLDDETFFVPAETRGTPVYTENFVEMSGGSFKGTAFPVQTMDRNSGLITAATYPAGDWADFTQKGEFWEHSYQWDPWYGQDALLFYAKVASESTAGAADAIGVIPGSYRFLYNENDGQSLTFSYRSAPTAQEQQDIVFAARKITKQEARKAIPILFYHALTGVKFATAYENDGAVKTFIKKVELTGLYGYGKCTIVPTQEDGNFSDVTTIRSSADAVSWDFTISGAAPSLGNVYSQEYSETPVTYSGGSFGSKGDYPTSFSQAGNKNNLNDADATMTFWFPSQTITDALKATVTFEIVVNGGTPKEYTLELDLGARLGSQKWEAGQLRTFTLKPNEVDVEIEDHVSGFEKTEVKITNTGNVDAYIRAMIVANWWGFAGNEEGVAYGYTSSDRSAYVQMWERLSLTADNYGGVFEGLAGDNWFPAKDGYFYFQKKVAPGATIGENLEAERLFQRYYLDTEAHPVPNVWYLDGTMKQFTNVYLRMEIPVQAIEAKADVEWDEAWEEVLGAKPEAL